MRREGSRASEADWWHRIIAHRVVFDRGMAESYQRWGWTVTERPEGGWSVVNPRLLGPETRAHTRGGSNQSPCLSVESGTT